LSLVFSLQIVSVLGVPVLLLSNRRPHSWKSSSAGYRPVGALWLHPWKAEAVLTKCFSPAEAESSKWRSWCFCAMIAFPPLHQSSRAFPRNLAGPQTIAKAPEK